MNVTRVVKERPIITNPKTRNKIERGDPLGTVQFLKLVKKFGKYFEKWFKNFISSVGAPDSSIPVTNNENYAYMGNVYMGSNKQKFLVHLDTGSNKLLVFDSNCNSCPSKALFNTA
jgi:hypothetical protein